MKEKYLAVSFTILLIFMPITGSMTDHLVKAPEMSSGQKQVTSVRVKEDDTLWSIAKKYYTEEFRDLTSYIYEIQMTNRISDTIQIGQNLIIPYFAKKKNTDLEHTNLRSIIYDILQNTTERKKRIL